MSNLYTVGLMLVILYFLMGIDDFIWDIITVFKRLGNNNNKLNLENLEKQPPKILAVVIAAWQESNVIEDVIDNFIESTQYPKSMYHIFLGVYPNDDLTVDAAKALSKKYSNVHTIINGTPGPTCKAQNLNYVISKIKKFEIDKNWRFASISVHDSEDVVHPYELKVTNYLIGKYPALQFPVFPLMQKPTFRNFFKNLTTSTYADEFSENHFTTMVSRCRAGAFVPSAGTGFALSRETIDSFGDDDVLPEGSLTEDYRLSLTLYQKGISMLYVLERLPRVTDDNKIVWDYIATRSIFPNTFKTAVKQKTRWILGITMQSFSFRDIFRSKDLGFVGKYSLYKDSKAKIGNLVNLLGYPFLIYFLLSFIMDLPAIYPKYTFSWYMSLVITIMMIERQLFRAFAIYNVYGVRSVFFSCLFPPLIPIRFVWGNIINFTATVRAYNQSFNKRGPIIKAIEKIKVKELFKANGTSKNLKKKKVFAWAKTDHAFLEKDILIRYHRKIGDILLEKGYIAPDNLKLALQESVESNVSIGNVLLKKELITEGQLLCALSSVKQIQYIEMESLQYYEFSKYNLEFNQSLLKELLIFPLLKTPKGYVVVFCDDSHLYAQTFLKENYNIAIKPVFASREVIEKGIEMIYSNNQNTPSSSVVLDLYHENKINYEQVIISNNYIKRMGAEKLMAYMGLAKSGSREYSLELFTESAM